MKKLGPQTKHSPNYLFLIYFVSSDEIKPEILILKNKKASREGDISVNTYLPILTKVINSSIEKNEFPNELKLADVLPIYKKTLLMKKILGLWASCHVCLKFLRNF